MSLVKQLEERSDVEDPEALAGWIARNKYGHGKFDKNIEGHQFKKGWNKPDKKKEPFSGQTHEGHAELKAWMGAKRADRAVAAVARKEAREKAAVKELPNLQGSQKQVDWAKSIRDTHLKELSNIEARQVKPEMHGLWDAGIKHLKSRESASYWIDNRSRDSMRLMGESMNHAVGIRRDAPFAETLKAWKELGK